jgi:(p)ppGpp synthase/HD superfamily hydrolase
MIGYSDRINHALAFAAKHHDRQVRSGMRLPYLTQPANVAIILTRYGRDEDAVVAGILHDVIEDCVREGWTPPMLEERIGAKFGSAVVALVCSVTLRRTDDDGVDLSAEESREDALRRLADARDDALWVCAADSVHNAQAIVSDLRRTAFPESVWDRYPAGRDGTIHWYQRVADRLRAIGFATPIVDELDEAVAALRQA